MARRVPPAQWEVARRVPPAPWEVARCVPPPPTQFPACGAISPTKLHALSGREEHDDEIIDFLPVFDRLFPFGGDARQAVIGSGDLPVDGADGIGIAAQIDGGDHSVAEAFRGMEGPQGGVQRADAPAGIVDGFPRGIR